MIVLDTTALSAAMRYDDELTAFLLQRRPGNVATVPPAVAEIDYGIRRLPAGSRRRRLLEHERDRLLGTIRLLEWSPEASRLFGTIKADLEHAGTPIDDFDVAIAAVAMAHGAAVLTANVVRFERESGLEVRHWRDA